MKNRIQIEPEVYIPPAAMQVEHKYATRGTAAVMWSIGIALFFLFFFARQLTAWATATEKFWGVVSTVITVSGTILGLWFIWLKFIHGREFANKLEITCTPTKALLSDSKGNVHAIGIKLENKGTSAIRGYGLEVSTYLHKDNAIAQSPIATTNWVLLREEEDGATIDVGAASYAQYITSISLTQAEVITFVVKVTAQEHSWKNFVTVSNSADTEEEKTKA